MSNDFAKAAHHLPKETREKLTKVFFLLTSDPRHPSLQVKKIKGAKRNDVYECRIDKSWRMVMCDMGQMQYDLIAIGEHDKTINLGKSVAASGAIAGMGIAGAAAGTAGAAATTSGLAALGGGSLAAGGGGMAAGQAVVNTLNTNTNCSPLGVLGSIFGLWGRLKKPQEKLSHQKIDVENEMLRLSLWLDGDDSVMEFLSVDLSEFTNP